jgi:hypothetical protein
MKEKEETTIFKTNLRRKYLAPISEPYNLELNI